MSMQTNDKMSDVVNAVAEILKNNQAMPINKMPILAQEIIDYAVVSNLIGLGIALLVAFGFTLTAANIADNSSVTKEEKTTVQIFWSLGIFAACVLIFIFSSILLRAMTQPNIYIMQKITEMQKESK